MSKDKRHSWSWVVSSDDYSVSVGEVRNDGTSLTVADFHFSHQIFGDHARALKKAQLCAAAPDLLEALQWVLKTHSMCADERASIRAAIAKATGGAP